MSTGMANIKDIRKAYKQAKISGSKDLALLQCTSFYPEEDKDLELSNIQWLKHKFNCPVGFSDHSLGINNVVLCSSILPIIMKNIIRLTKIEFLLTMEFQLKKMN